jgi:exoenzyme U
MSETLSQDQWINRVLGVSYVRKGTQPLKQVRFAPMDTLITPPPPRQPIMIGTGRTSGKRVGPPTPPPSPTEFTGEGGKKITISKTPGGGVIFTAPPPPVGEITFSGGGGKGAALPGAVRALEESGVLKTTKKIAGASVGSMTAALVAAGITADEFTEIANADSTTERIVEGTGGTKKGLLARAIKNKVTTGSGNPLTGQGLEDTVRDVLDDTLRKRIMEFTNQCASDKKPVPDEVQDVAVALANNKDGATFGQLRILSKHIPAVKEVVITGTYTTEFEKDDKGKLKKVKDGNDRGKLYIFDADSEPFMPVCKAVHASASFPGAFKPVDLELSTGMTVRFIDGGVMNNTPTTSSIGNERNLDPVPESRGMTFVFEDKDGESDLLLQGVVDPAQGKKAQLVDWFVGSDHNGAEYSKNRDMLEHLEEVVVVPLTVTLPPKKPGKKPKKYDMRDGTLEFNLPLDAKLALQDKTRQATNSQILREQQPKTREYASDEQMFVSIGMGDLKSLAQSGYPGASDAVTFRERVAEMIGKLVEAVEKEGEKNRSDFAGLLKDHNVSMALDELNSLAGDNVDFQGYVGREMNKGRLDLLLDAMRKGGGRPGGAMEATMAVGEAVIAHNAADNVLKDFVYPKMKMEKDGGAGIETLIIMEGLLKGAKSKADVNLALKTGIDHFKNKPDARPRRGHKKFAENLESRIMR